jgi:hypothetical protein
VPFLPLLRNTNWNLAASEKKEVHFMGIDFKVLIFGSRMSLLNVSKLLTGKGLEPGITGELGFNPWEGQGIIHL